MGERDRNQGYYGRHDGDEQRNDVTQRDRGARDDYQRAQNRDNRDYGSYQDRSAGNRHSQDEHREYGERQHSQENYATQRYPIGGFSSYEGDRDWDRSQRGYDQDRNYLRHDGERNTYGQGSAYGQSSERTRPYDWQSQRSETDRAHGSSDYRRGSTQQGYAQRDWRDASQQNFGLQRDWRDVNERNHARDYGARGRGYPENAWGERNHAYDNDAWQRHGDESWTQQLRDAAQHVARKVKHAFRGPKGYKRSDERIREDVNDRLAQQDRMDPSDIEVSVANGEVTLTGTVGHRHDKFLAEEIADDVSGVNDVHNQLRLRREQPTTSAATNEANTTVSNQNATEAARNRNARA